jgi:O-antigen/teichoic acid export membrane protein
MRWLGFGEIETVAVVLAPVLLVAIAAATTMRYLILRERDYLAIGRATIIQNSGKAGTQICLGAFTPALVPLIFGEVIGRLASYATLLRDYSRLDAVAAEGRGRISVVLVRANRQFPLFSLPSAILDTLGGILVVPLIASMYGAAAAGQFVLAFQVTAFPMAIVGRSVADSFHAVLADARRATPEAMMRVFRHTFLMMASVAALPVACLLLWGPGIFAFVFGRSWSVAGDIAGYLMLGAAAQLVVSPLSRAMVVLNGQRRKLLYDVLSVFVTVGTITSCHHSGLTLQQTVLVLSLAQLGAYAVYFWLIRGVITRAEQLCAV